MEVEGLTLWDLNRPVWEVKEEDDTGSNSNSLVDAAILHSDIKVSAGSSQCTLRRYNLRNLPCGLRGLRVPIASKTCKLAS